MNAKNIASTILIVASLSWGCGESSSGEQESSGNKQAPQKEQVQEKKQVQAPAVKQENSAGEIDKFNRKPGDAHYGHNHATNQPHTNKTNAQKAPGAASEGELDEYGRKPGHEHYGHGHE